MLSLVASWAWGERSRPEDPSVHSVKSRDKPATRLAPFAVVVGCHGSVEVTEISPVCTHTVFIWPFINLFIYIFLNLIFGHLGTR